MASEARGEGSAGPQVRNACEECHSRKIKCHTTSDGGCRACQNNGRLCFFLPRNKSGRPKVGEDGTKEGKQSNPGLGTTAAAAAAAMAEHAAMAEASTPMSQSLHQQSRTGSNSIQSSSTSSRSPSQHSNNMIRPRGPPRSMSDTYLDMTFPILDSIDWQNAPLPKSSSDLIDMDWDSTFQYQELPPPDGYFDYHRMNINMASQHLHTTSLPSLDTLGTMPSAPGTEFNINMASQHLHSASQPSLESLGTMPSVPSSDFNFNKAGPDSFFPTPFSSMPTASMSAPSEQKGPEGCFPTLLGHIYRLQRCHEKVRSGTLFSFPHTRNNQLKIVVATIDSGCIATCSTLKDQFQAVVGQRAEAKMNGMNMDFRGSPPIRPDHSLIALAITTILTIARLCQALMQSELPDAQSSLDNMLLFKRLGCNILQTRIALMNIEKLDRGLAYLTEDATREISIVQTEFENMKKNAWNNQNLQ